MTRLAQVLVHPDWRSRAGLAATGHLRDFHRYTAHVIGTAYDVFTADNGPSRRPPFLSATYESVRPRIALRPSVKGPAVLVGI
jgi:hypothetical protein